MTENEAINELQANIDLPFGFTVSDEVSAMAIQALEEIQRYRAIGTIEEFKALKEKSVAKKVIAPPCNACDKELCDYDCKYFLTTYTDEYKCPTCHTNQVYIPEYEIRLDCCPNCGQKLDWQ